MVLGTSSPPGTGTDGEWRSLVAHLTGGQEAAGSNPASPTTAESRSIVVSYPQRIGVGPPSPAPEVLSGILAGLPGAEWDYIPDGGWMEVFLTGSRGRGGVVEPLGDDLEISVHPETNVPLSIIIPGFRAWLGRQQGTAPVPPDAPINYAVAQKHLERVLRSTPELAAAVASELGTG